MSRVEFKAVRWKSFLSSGGQFTEVRFETKTTLIQGENGAGKSTLLDAISFALFDKPFRSINKPQLVNSILGKEALVEVEFKTRGHDWLVRRGIKPNKFEIIRDGQLVDQTADGKDYQAWLENDVLGRNHKTFRQVDVLGSSRHVPFMQLKAHERRAVVEDLLDIQVFSTMNSILKDKISGSKQRLRDAEKAEAVAEGQLEVARTQALAVELDNEGKIATLEEKIKAEAQRGMDLTFAKKGIAQEIENLKTQIADEEVNKREVISTRNELTRAQAELHSSERDFKFFQDHDNCPTCQQAIDVALKKKKAEKFELDADCVRIRVSQLQTRLEQLTTRETQVAAVRRGVDAKQMELYRLELDLKSAFGTIKRLQDEVEGLKNKTSITVDTAAYEEVVERARVQRVQVEEDHKVLEAAGTLLKDGGIKARVIRQYVPVMNRLLSKYLALLDFHCQFELDENFEETIRSRYRDTFSYESFSEGEKDRIDLAILFTWRAIAQSRGSASSNLLIFDEVLDSSLDLNGMDELMKIITHAEGDEKIVVISHRGDALVDKFERCLKFTKVQNFTTVTEL